MKRIYEKLKSDCRYFPGDRPCVFHKRDGVVCSRCVHYSSIKHRILIIKRDAMGDVLRTTFLLPILREKYPDAHITWIVSKSSHDVLLGNPWIDHIVIDDAKGLASFLAERFDVSINLDLDRISLSLATIAKAKKKYGFMLDDKGFVKPLNKTAAGWFNMSAFDHIKKANRLTYQELAAKTCNFEFGRESIIVPLGSVADSYAESFRKKNRLFSKKTVGLNIGSGSRWLAKRWPIEHWKALAKILRKHDFNILIFGGDAEKDIERELLMRGVISTGTDNTIPQFFALLNLVDIVVTGDTMALHAGLGLGKKVVALFGPTSANEIEMYGQGKKVVVNHPCAGCYHNVCPKNEECLKRIEPKRVFDIISKLLKA